MKPIPDIDLEELRRSIERNQEERFEYIRFKVRSMREQGQIVGPGPEPEKE